MAGKETKSKIVKGSLIAKSFGDILKRNNNDIQEQRANFIVKGAGKHHQAKKDLIQGKIDDVNMALTAMADLSTNNNTTTMNAIENFDHKEFVDKRHNLRKERALLKIDLQLLKEDDNFYDAGDIVIEDV